MKGLDCVEYEATKYATAANRAAKMKAPGVLVDISREDSTVVVESYGGGRREPTTRSGTPRSAPSRSSPRWEP